MTASDGIARASHFVSLTAFLSLAPAAIGADVPADLPLNGIQAPVFAADVFGGYASDHVVVKVKPGVAPRQNADGGWTFAATGAPSKPAKNGRVAPDAVAALLAGRKTSGVERTLHTTSPDPALVTKHGIDRWYTIHVPAGTDAPAMAAELAKLTSVFERAEVDGIGGITGIPNDTNFAMQWNMNNTGQNGGTPDADIDAPEAWDLATGSAAYVLGILDTGVQPNHPDLNGKVLSGYSTVTPGPFSGDPNGHGTHCAGIAAARGNDGIGVAGVSWGSTILPVQVVNSSGSGTTTQCADGIIYAADQGVKTISMSLQYYTLNTALSDAVNYAFDFNITLIAATGNFSAAGTIAYPAKFPNCMAIGATNKLDAKYTGSNNGPEIDVVAPGEAIYSSWTGSTYSTQTGTSMATPHVAGEAAVLKAINPTFSNVQIERIIKLSVEDKGAVGFDTLFGYGRINLRMAVDRAIPSCPGNTNFDGQTNIDDLLLVINSWGPCALCLADIAPTGGNGQVNIDDLLMVINGWGACP